MANILVDAQKGLEVGAEDVLKALTFLKAAQTKAVTAEPAVVAALGTLLGGVATAMTATAGAAAAPVNIPLDISAFNAITSVWPEVVTFASSIGIKL